MTKNNLINNKEKNVPDDNINKTKFNTIKQNDNNINKNDIANNIPVGIVLITIGVPLSLQMGINPFITAVAISFSSNLAYTIPPAFVPVATCYAYPYGGGKYTLRWGIVMALISIVLCALLIYPLGSLFA